MAATSAEVKSLPSCHLTPWRSWNVHTLPSSLGSHDSARPGAMLAVVTERAEELEALGDRPYGPRSCMWIGSSGPAGVW